METENKSCENCEYCLMDKKQSSDNLKFYGCYYQTIPTGNLLSCFAWGYPLIMEPLSKHGHHCVAWKKRKNAREIPGT